MAAAKRPRFAASATFEQEAHSQPKPLQEGQLRRSLCLIWSRAGERF